MGILISALKLSPGDFEWLRRARAAILSIKKKSSEDPELAKQVELAAEWLDLRLKNQDTK